MRASPLNWVTPQAAPTLSIHGTEDHLCRLRAIALDYGEADRGRCSRRTGNDSGAGHGFKGADAERAEARAFAFFDKYLKTAASAATHTDLGSRPEG